MDVSDFISSYISKCAADKISSPVEICSKIRSDISEIDEALSQVEPLRVERLKLQKTLEHFSSLLQTQKISSEFDDFSKEAIAFREKIYNIIAESNPISNRDIIQKVGYNLDAKVIRAVKFLHERGVVDRDQSSERKIIPGPEWKSFKTLNSKE